jgi:hypothetical protein
MKLKIFWQLKILKVLLGKRFSGKDLAIRKTGYYHPNVPGQFHEEDFKNEKEWGSLREIFVDPESEPWPSESW